jgi:hypothetical protein
MLRERENDHDAAPAARAVSTDDRTDKAAPSQCNDRPGDTPHPHATPAEGSVQNGCTLTDEEREAIETADAYMSASGCYNTNVQKTLRGLLERLK